MIEDDTAKFPRSRTTGGWVSFPAIAEFREARLVVRDARPTPNWVDTDIAGSPSSLTPDSEFQIDGTCRDSTCRGVYGPNAVQVWELVRV